MVFALATGYSGSATSGGGIFESSSILFLFLFFFLYAMSFVAKGFMLATFFGKARTGGLTSCVIFLSGWFLQVNFSDPATPLWQKTLIALLFPVGGLSYGIDLLATLESGGAGARWSTLFLKPDGLNGFSFAGLLELFVLQIVLHTFLGWYLEQALPSKYGIRQPPWFVFMPSYWRPPKTPIIGPSAESNELHELHRTGLSVEREGERGGERGGEQSGRVIEGLSAEMQLQQAAGACIEIRGLRKVFSTPDGQLVAVANLHLSMFQGQIFALLGHNGAGKTTTISMLTGMTFPTAGEQKDMP